MAHHLGSEGHWATHQNRFLVVFEGFSVCGLVTLVDVLASPLRKGHATLFFCMTSILRDDLRREYQRAMGFGFVVLFGFEYLGIKGWGFGVLVIIRLSQIESQCGTEFLPCARTARGLTSPKTVRSVRNPILPWRVHREHVKPRSERRASLVEGRKQIGEPRSGGGRVASGEGPE